MNKIFIAHRYVFAEYAAREICRLRRSEWHFASTADYLRGLRDSQVEIYQVVAPRYDATNSEHQIMFKMDAIIRHQGLRMTIIHLP